MRGHQLLITTRLGMLNIKYADVGKVWHLAFSPTNCCVTAGAVGREATGICHAAWQNCHGPCALQVSHVEPLARHSIMMGKHVQQHQRPHQSSLATCNV